MSTRKRKVSETISASVAKARILALDPRPRTQREFALSNFELFYIVYIHYRNLLLEIDLPTRITDEERQPNSEDKCYWAKLLSIDDLIKIMKQNQPQPFNKFRALRKWYQESMTADERIRVQMFLPNSQWQELKTLEEFKVHLQNKLPVKSLFHKRNLKSRIAFLKGSRPEWYKTLVDMIEEASTYQRKKYIAPKGFKPVYKWSEGFKDQMLELIRDSNCKTISEIKKLPGGKNFYKMLQERGSLHLIHDIVGYKGHELNQPRTAREHIKCRKKKSEKDKAEGVTKHTQGRTYRPRFARAVDIINRVEEGIDDIDTNPRFTYLWTCNVKDYLRLFDERNLNISSFEELKAFSPSLARVLNARPIQRNQVFEQEVKAARGKAEGLKATV